MTTMKIKYTNTWQGHSIVWVCSHDGYYELVHVRGERRPADAPDVIDALLCEAVDGTTCWWPRRSVHKYLVSLGDRKRDYARALIKYWDLSRTHLLMASLLMELSELGDVDEDDCQGARLRDQISNDIELVDGEMIDTWEALRYAPHDAEWHEWRSCAPRVIQGGYTHAG